MGISSNYRILWVRVGECLPLDSGGRIRSYHTLRELNLSHDVTVLHLQPSWQEPTNEAVCSYAREVRRSKDRLLPRVTSSSFWRLILPLLRNFLFSSQPFALWKYASDKFVASVQELLDSGNYDLVVCDGLATAITFEKVTRKSGVPMVLFQHNVESLIWLRMARIGWGLKRLYYKLHARRMEVWEAWLAGLFDGVIALSQEDEDYHRHHYHLGNVIGHVPAGVEVTITPQDAAARQRGLAPVIGYLGSMDWLPNQDAVDWFCREIWPLVRTEVPDVRFVVIGRNPPRWLEQMARTQPGIEVTGWVDDIRPHLHRCSVLAVPLRAGSGTRIKILEALAEGVPVVTTLVGAEGLPLAGDSGVWMADDPATFASRLSRLLIDAPLRSQMAAHGVERARTDFGWEQSAEAFVGLCERLMSPVNR